MVLLLFLYFKKTVDSETLCKNSNVPGLLVYARMANKNLFYSVHNSFFLPLCERKLKQIH